MSECHALCNMFNVCHDIWNTRFTIFLSRVGKWAKLPVPFPVLFLTAGDTHLCTCVLIHHSMFEAALFLVILHQSPFLWLQARNQHFKKNSALIETQMGFNRGEKTSSNNRKALLCPSLGCGLQSNRQNVRLSK